MSGPVDALIARLRAAARAVRCAFRTAQEADAGAKRLGNALAAVGRAVVRDNDLHRPRIVLGQSTFQTVA